MAKSAPIKPANWNPPPLDWRKFDDPCCPMDRKKKLRRRLGVKK